MYSATSTKQVLSYIIITLLCSYSVFGLVEEAHSQGLDSLFLSDDLLYLELRTDYKALENERWKEDEKKGGEPEYQQATMVYGGEDNRVEVPVRVKARGNFRRNPAYCKFPPLMLNFKKKDVENTLFDKQDKVKVVTTCQTEPDVIKEYVVYKMYNLISDFSYNVRLAKILYVDTNKNKKLNERFGFIIEEDERVAKRNDATVVRKHHYPFDLNPDNEAKLSMFEFMIGNPDFYYTTGQNMDIMHPKDTTLAPLGVPYDFDYSEFVNAAYTKPAGVPTDMLAKKKIFKGMCLSDEKLDEVIEYYNIMKPKFISIINDNEYLPKYSKKECLTYLEEFYAIINTQDLLQTEVLDTCYTRKDYLPLSRILSTVW